MQRYRLMDRWSTFEQPQVPRVRSIQATPGALHATAPGIEVGRQVLDLLNQCLHCCACTQWQLYLWRGETWSDDAKYLYAVVVVVAVVISVLVFVVLLSLCVTVVALVTVVASTLLARHQASQAHVTGKHSKLHTCNPRPTLQSLQPIIRFCPVTFIVSCTCDGNADACWLMPVCQPSTHS